MPAFQNKQENTSQRIYTALTGAGFIAVICIGIIFYIQLRVFTVKHSQFIQESYRGHIHQLSQENLERAARYIEKHYPILRDPQTLSAEAETDRLRQTSREWAELAQAFGLAGIYYMEKNGETWRVLISSGPNHPEWLITPPLADHARASGEPAWSPDADEGSTPASIALPIISGGKTAGVLGASYPAIPPDSPLSQRERLLEQREQSLLRGLLITFLITMLFILLLAAVRMLMSRKTAPVPPQSMEAEEYSRTIMNSMPVSCTLWGEDGRLLYTNDVSLKLYGISRGTFTDIGAFLDRCPEFQPDGTRSRDFAAAKIKSALETGYECFEWVYQPSEGETLPVETTIVRVAWHDRCRLAIYTRDMRDIKAKEKAAREAEERMRVMLDTMVFACFFFDSGGIPIDCNQRALDLFGSQDKAAFLRDFFGYSPEYQSDGSRSRDKARENILLACGQGRNMFRWDHLKADGTPLPAEITLVRIAWNDGYRIVAYLRDLSSLMETEDNLRRILSLVEGSPNIVFYIGAKGGIEYMNPAVSSLTGFTKEELVKDGLGRIFSPEDFTRLGAEYLAAARDNHTVNFEMGVFDREGSRRDFAFSAFPAELYGGKTGAGILGRDITELKRIQRDLTAAKEATERALAQERYYQKAKSDFLSRVTHELRTPMNGIIGMTGAARKALSREEQARCFDTIETAANHLLGIVNDILDMTSLDLGGFDFTPQSFSFSAAMRAVIGAAQDKADAKGLVFTADIDGGIPGRLIGDERRLKQALLHLLSNAVKFTPEKGAVGLKAVKLGEEDGECAIRFEVSDTGIGIEAEALWRLWEIFEQADSGIARRFEGIGLGLPLTKRIIELMNGNIRVESAPGKGSRLICDIRLGVDKAASADTGGDAAALDLSGRRILVVDDSDINREVLSAFLEDTGAVLEEAKDGEEAIRIFSQHPFDLVLMDLHMPVLDGFAASLGIRSSALPWASAPVILVTAETNPEILKQCAKSGVNDRLSKPVEAGVLFEKIAQWLPR
ncbi:MAG: PAS domain S-box protein [Treponema sp.]|jgi:PAS domain S-box-containing protein|nr:PAS domain S-box protein [Treponema sp.]